jgi:hypothetical protein
MAAPVSVVVVQRLADRRLVESAVVGPDGITARPTDNVASVAWQTLLGGDRMYYLARVSVVQRPGDGAADVVATRLLSPVLSELRALAGGDDR